MKEEIELSESKQPEYKGRVIDFYIMKCPSKSQNQPIKRETHSKEILSIKFYP